MKSIAAELGDAHLVTCRMCGVPKPEHQVEKVKNPDYPNTPRACLDCRRIDTRERKERKAREAAEANARLYQGEGVAKPRQSVIPREHYDPGQSRAFFRNDGHKHLKSWGVKC